MTTKPATDAEIVQELREEADRLTQRVYSDRCGSPDCALAANLASRAADALEALATARADALEEAAKVALDDDARDWIENRANDLFRDYRCRRGGSGPASGTPRDYLEYWLMEATREWFAAAIRALEEKTP